MYPAVWLFEIQPQCLVKNVQKPLLLILKTNILTLWMSGEISWLEHSKSNLRNQLKFGNLAHNVVR